MPKFIEPTLFEDLRKSRALPSPSGVRLTIMLKCVQENPDMVELLRLVQADPVLSGRIIRIVNVLNADRVRPIASVSIDSLLLIGLQAIRQLALALSLAELGAPTACTNFSLPHFWSRSFAMASSAQVIAGHTKVAPLAEMFTTGLLSNVGKLTLASAQPAIYSSLLAKNLDNATQIAMEQSLFGFNHLSVAAALMQDWKIPLLFCDAVLHYETPMASGMLAESRQQEVVWTLNLASMIAELGCGPTSAAKGVVHRVGIALGNLHLVWDDFIELYEQAGKDWHEWSKTMKLGSQLIWKDLPMKSKSEELTNRLYVINEKHRES
jgi:HD-like signal output (HDOD) protein